MTSILDRLHQWLQRITPRGRAREERRTRFRDQREWRAQQETTKVERERLFSTLDRIQAEVWTGYREDDGECEGSS